jgi:Flp pilus assembly protein TadG
MTPTLRIALSTLRRFRAAERGVAAVEFALVLPFMALLYLGGFEVMEEISANRQVSLTSSTIASIVSQYSTISQSETMPGILAASTSVLTPFSSANAVVTVSLITVDSTGKATITWSQTTNGSGRTVGATVTLPAALDIPNTYVILGETSYTYTPTIDFLHRGTMNLYSSIYMLPRQPGTIALTT